eukprot:scaffold161240_cov48-Prasinocladus_malaysianus.AAC.1
MKLGVQAKIRVFDSTSTARDNVVACKAAINPIAAIAVVLSLIFPSIPKSLVRAGKLAGPALVSQNERTVLAKCLGYHYPHIRCYTIQCKNLSKSVPELALLPSNSKFGTAKSGFVSGTPE